MANCYTTGVAFRQGKCRRLVEGVENSTGRRVVLAVYNDDGILEADKERNILRSLKDCDFVVDLIAFIGHDYEARSRWRDPNSGTMLVVYEHLDTDLDLYRRALQPAPRVAGDRLRSLFFQLLSGVAAVHEKGFYLRDLRPGKVRIRRDPFLAKLSDFLGAKVPHPFAQDTDLVTPPGELERDLRYQAPEQLIGSQMLTPAVDMWALATIIAEVATGDVLFKVNPNSRPREHLQTIYQLLGTPAKEKNPYPPDVDDQWRTQKPYVATLDLNETFLPFLGPLGSQLLVGMLRFKPTDRITAREALNGNYFQGYVLVRA